jgi:Na+-transporting methylmalonyl-CoA/oxaloacetate decarboxylase gamma subunit
MNSETLRVLAEDISRQVILDNWQFYVILGFLTLVVSAIGAYVSTSMSRKAERDASRVGFELVLEQLKESTALAESIKVEVHQLSARTEKLRWLKSEKLEDYVVAILRAAEFLSRDMQYRYFDAPQPAEEDPLMHASMLQKLYLPELDEPHAMYLRATGNFRSWIAQGMAERLEAMKAGKGKPSPSAAHLAQYSEHQQALNAAVMLIENEAKTFARKLHETS